MSDKPGKGRVTLKEYFEADKMPTEGNFADLVDSALNKTDDQLFINVKGEGENTARFIGVGSTDPNSPLSIQNRTGDSKLIGLESNSGSEEWNISINPENGNNGLLIVNNDNPDASLMLDANGNIGMGTLQPDTNLKLDVKGEIKGSKVWNAVWNDIADYQLLDDELLVGRCYYDTPSGAKICNQRCQLSAIGIATDTFGFGIGQHANQSEVPIAVAGWVLAFVDQEYDCGIPLTNNEKGFLTAMTLEEKQNYPERLLAIYKKKEMATSWGDEQKKITVNGRHWVKVK